MLMVCVTQHLVVNLRSRFMKHVVISGHLGSGKTTLERYLVQKHNFLQPDIFLTRNIDDNMDRHISHVSCEEFFELFQENVVSMPMCFGENWYGYSRKSIMKALNCDSKFVFNVRPYTGLLLKSILDGCVSVWVHADKETRVDRIENRSEMKDTQEKRMELDENESVYKSLYDFVFESTDQSSIKSFADRIIASQ